MSEIEDQITRRKALERGNRLMFLFWEASGATVGSAIDKATRRSGSEIEDEQTLSGADLSSQTASQCVTLLMRAKEEYEGQRLHEQANRADR